MFGIEHAEFWVEHMINYYFEKEQTWEWAFFVCHDGEITVRHGPFWHDTGIYATKRRIIGCEWE